MELLQDPGSPGSSSPPTPRASTPRFHPYAASSSSGRRLEEGALRRIVLTEEPYGAYYAFRLGTQTLLRREGSNLINGTKLLNAAGLTRGRRDALLKAEKEKHVGIWRQRALYGGS